MNIRLFLTTVFLVTLACLAWAPPAAQAATPCDGMVMRMFVSKTFTRTVKGNWPAVAANPQIPTGIPAGYRVMYATYFQGQPGVQSQVIRGATKPLDASDEAYWRAGLPAPGTVYFSATLYEPAYGGWGKVCSTFVAVYYHVYLGGLVFQDGIFQPNPGGRGSIVGR